MPVITEPTLDLASPFLDFHVLPSTCSRRGIGRGAPVEKLG